MANSFVRYTGNGSTTAYSISYTYRDAADLIVSVNGVATTAYSLNAAGTTLTFDSAPASSSAIEIRRKTSQTTRLTDYAAGSVLTENDLDTDSTQAFFMGQEAIDDANDVIKISSTDFQFNAINKQIRNVANPTSNQDVATKHYLENTFLTTANKTALTTINANIANIIAVNNNATNINSAVSNSTNINLVANNIGSVNVVATDIAKVIEVANDLQEAVSEVETVADDLNEATSEIDTVAVNIANVNLVGNSINNVNALAPKVTELGLLGTSAVVTDLGILGTSANVTAMGHLGTSANVTAMGLLGTSAVVTDMGLLGTSANVTAMGLLGNSTVISNISTVSSKNTEIGLLGTSANVTAMGHLGTSANVTAMGLLGTSSVVSNMGNLGTSSNVTNMSTLAGISGLSTLASNNANVTAVAGKVTEIGLLGTSANVTNMATLGTSTNVSNMSTLAGITNLNNLANAHASVTSVANNLASVNAFGETYRIASSAPTTSLNSGDLYFNTSTNVLNVYGASGWQNAGSSVNGTSERFKFVASGTPTTLTGNDANGNTLAYDAGFIDVYLNGIKMVNGTDVTVTSGSSIVFASALTNGDIVEAVTFGTFSVANLNASNLTSGTVPDARISGTYTGLTGLDLTDGSKIRLGTGNDLEIYHSGTQSVISDVGSGNLNLEGDAKIVLRSSGGSENYAQFFKDGAVELYYDNAKKFETTSDGVAVTGDLTVDTNTLKVDSSNNNVGIGTASPNSITNLHVADTYANEPMIRIETSDSGNKRLDLYVNGGHGYVTATQSAQSLNFASRENLIFKTNTSSERARIDASGNFMVGKTASNYSSPGVEAKSNGNLIAVRDSGNVVNFIRNSNDGSIVTFSKDTTNFASIGVNGDNLVIDGLASDHSGLDFANDKIFPRRNSSASNNTVDLGYSGGRFKDIYLGGGAFIGGTGTANKLDDYEEGTWTPAYRGASSAGSYSTNASGTYTKVGNLVSVTAHLKNITQNSAGSGSIQIAGLPFAKTSSQESDIGSIYLNLFSLGGSDKYAIVNVNPSASVVLITAVDSDGASASTLQLSARQSDSADMFFSITYTT